METIGQLITTDRQNVSNLPVATQQLSPALRQKTMLVRQKYGERDKFLVTLNPSVQKIAGRHPDRAFFGEAPTLTIMRKTYGENMATMWLMPQILDLVTYSNSKGTLNEQQAEFLAEAIANEYYFLKASELMLFFYRFKCGTYGHFYGVVDPMKIMEGLKLFMKEREREIMAHDDELKRKEREEDAKNAISPQEYCRLHGLPEMDDVLDIIEYMNKSANVNPPSTNEPQR